MLNLSCADLAIAVTAWEMKFQTKMRRKPHPWIAHNFTDPIHLSVGFGLSLKILSGWDLRVWPDTKSMAIYSSGYPTAAQPSPPIRAAGGSCASNGSCLGLVTQPFAPICSLAGSVQVSVSSTADAGGWQRQEAECGCSRAPVRAGAVSTPAGRAHFHLLNTARSCCQFCVPCLCYSFKTSAVKGLQAGTFWRKPDLCVQQVCKGSLTLSYYPFVLMTQDMLQIKFFRGKGAGLLLGCFQTIFSNFCS